MLTAVFASLIKEIAPKGQKPKLRKKRDRSRWVQGWPWGRATLHNERAKDQGYRISKRCLVTN